MRFSNSIRRVGKMSKREVVLDLMRIAGAENDEAKFMRLLIENPISRTKANEAWAIGRKQRAVFISSTVKETK